MNIYSFQSSNSLDRYRLYSNEDYLQLPVEVISPLSNNTLACESGPDVGLVDIARHQKKGILKVNNSIKVAGQNNWQMPNVQFACGLSTSLYDHNPFTGEVNGEPIADCFAICAQENNAILSIADGVNWGYKPRLAARCAIHGAMACLNQQLFERKLNTTKDVFERINAAIHAAQQLIIENNGSLTTLTVSIVCPSNRRWFVCSAIVGDSNAYVYSRKQKSVFELTQGSRNLNDERDMRSPGGALGMTMTEKADLSNLTYSLMEIEQGDFVFLTTDGISDNYDPCVSGSAASVKTPLLVRKSSNSISDIPLTLMTAYERHSYSLRRMHLSIADNEEQLNALELCNRLLQYVIRLTAEQRHIIEQGVRENEGIQGSARNQFEIDMRDKVGKVPGKLDHASIVVYQVR
ncbi:unnamed protein product [Rotaria sp. Silwood1]|nr:unnamed protein product [Rotaria sp. Silwood1]CAF3448278.1 unnamed protein product [Rotaria sp. Silwood1]CAF4836434.1 unnamed protein product [Rotaria sp. Silwood1]CAF4844942.1 unnamed protein product [Rotaria sp. Silwood1]